LTKVSEEFAPHYLAGIRHDIRQTTNVGSVINTFAKIDQLARASVGS
jgi:hypothetical protein